MVSDLERLRDDLRVFASARDWEQFHLPKNLVLALVGEVGEVAEPFQWRTSEESASGALDADARAAVEDELADVLLCLVRLADVLDVDLGAAARAKIARNVERYPAEEVRGSPAKRG